MTLGHMLSSEPARLLMSLDPGSLISAPRVPLAPYLRSDPHRLRLNEPSTQNHGQCSTNTSYPRSRRSKAGPQEAESPPQLSSEILAQDLIRDSKC